MTRDIDPIFNAKSVAVVGASTNPEKMGFQILQNIIRGGFTGKIYPVNPKAREILGIPCVNDPAALPERVDLAVMIIPAGAVSPTLDSLGERGVKSAIVITGGFAEAGVEGERLQEDLIQVGSSRGIRIIGPNCQGVNHPYQNLCASWPLVTLRGEMAIISQSGTVGAALIDWATEEKIGFSAFVSMGNRADVDESELIEYFSKEGNTKVITLYIEGVKDPERFQNALAGSTKPIIIYKAGRTARGRKAAESHTKSLAGRDEIFNALFKKHGVVRASSLTELYDYSKALAYLPRPRGRNLLIVTSSGGSAIIATDMAEEEGFRVVPLKRETETKLKDALPPHCIVSNPLDLTGDTDAERYGTVLDIVGNEYDMVMPIFGDPIPGAVDIVSSSKCHLVTYLGGADVERDERAKMGERKIAVFPTPERAVKAASLYLPGVSGEAVVEVEEERGDGRTRMLSPVDSFSLLERYGIPVSPYFKVNSAEEGKIYGSGLGYPLVMKVNSREVVHKSDEKGVILNIESPDAVESAYQELFERFEKKGTQMDGAFLAKQMPPGRELILGVTRDDQFGYAMAVGLGGIFVEVLKDVSFRLLPVTAGDIEEMVSELGGRNILYGVRGEAPSDVAALGKLAERVSRLVLENPSIAELDLNPVFLYEKGLCVIDGRIAVDHQV